MLQLPHDGALVHLASRTAREYVESAHGVGWVVAVLGYATGFVGSMLD